VAERPEGPRLSEPAEVLRGRVPLERLSDVEQMAQAAVAFLRARERYERDRLYHDYLGMESYAQYNATRQPDDPGADQADDFSAAFEPQARQDRVLFWVVTAVCGAVVLVAAAVLWGSTMLHLWRI
jgi:hypothetical protein